MTDHGYKVAPFSLGHPAVDRIYSEQEIAIISIVLLLTINDYIFK
jgi:hypothetical protein